MDKVQAFFACAREKEQAFWRIREIEGVEATGALPYNIEVNAGGINKGEALLWLAGELGIRREEILAFGDGANDADMIRMAGRLSERCGASALGGRVLRDGECT